MMEPLALTLLIVASLAATIANERRVMRQKLAEAAQREEQAREAGYFAGARETLLRAARRKPTVGRGIAALICTR